VHLKRAAAVVGFLLLVVGAGMFSLPGGLMLAGALLLASVLVRVGK
jgi:uncharacterized membrane protein